MHFWDYPKKDAFQQTYNAFDVLKKIENKILLLFNLRGGK